MSSMSSNFAASSLTAVQVGGRLGKYVIISELGRGWNGRGVQGPSARP